MMSKRWAALIHLYRIGLFRPTIAIYLSTYKK